MVLGGYVAVVSADTSSTDRLLFSYTGCIATWFLGTAAVGRQVFRLGTLVQSPVMSRLVQLNTPKTMTANSVYAQLAAGAPPPGARLHTHCAGKEL